MEWPEKEQLKSFYAGIRNEMIVQRIFSIGNAGKKNLTTKIYGYFFDKKYMYLIMEYAPGGTMGDYRNCMKPPEPIIVRILYDLCKTVKFVVHSNHIIHRDIAQGTSAMDIGGF